MLKCLALAVVALSVAHADIVVSRHVNQLSGN
jgi:hypothetical protein